nr:hypothetical protein [Tanacetum cinerariifolium]
HPIENSVMDTIDLEQKDASAGLGDENHCHGDENVEEFDPLFSYPHMQTDNNEGSNHNKGSNTNKGSDHNEGSDNNEEGEHNEGSDNNEGSGHNDGSDNNKGSDHNEGSDNNEGIYLEDFDSEIDSDDDEAERRNALRKL